MLNMVFRVDSSYDMGSGHMMRCLTLAQDLHSRNEGNINIHFICSDLAGNLSYLVDKEAYQLFIHRPGQDNSMQEKVSWQDDADKTIAVIDTLEGSVDWLIVDHYDYDIHWEQALRDHVKNIMVIDDLANRHHDCDILLDQNLAASSDARYEKLVPKKCQLLLGPQYALLRPEFKQYHSLISRQNNPRPRLLVLYGNTDPTQETIKALQAIQRIQDDKLTTKDFDSDVVVGNSNQGKEAIKALCQQLKNCQYYCQANNVAELMSKANFSIGAGGTTTLERLYMKLPTITTAVAENQVQTLQMLSNDKLILYLGPSEAVSIAELQNAILEFLQ